MTTRNRDDMPMTLSRFEGPRSLIAPTADTSGFRGLMWILMFSYLAIASTSTSRADEPRDDDVSIAVIGFDDRGPSVKLAPLRNALAEMLSGDLAKYEGLRATERLRISQFLDEQDLTDSSLVEQSAKRDVGKALAADYLVSGRYSATPEQISLQAVFYRVGNKKPLATWKLNASPDKLLELEQQLLAKILEALDVKPVLRSPPPAKQGPSPTLAVLGLKNLGVTTRLQSMQVGFSELLQSNLSALTDVRLVERDKLYKILAEQKLNANGLTDLLSAIRVGRLLGAQRFLYGSFLEIGDNLRVDLRLADTRSAQILRTESASGPTEQFAELLEDLALRVAADLAVEPPENAGKLIRAASPTRNIEAALHFTNANQKFYRGQFRQAAESYQRTLLVEPGNVHAGWGRLNSWYLAKEYQQAITAGEQTLNFKFLPEQSRLKEKVYDRLCIAYDGARNYPKLDQTYRRLIREFPETRYGPRLRLTRALSLMEIGRREEAIASLEAAVKEKQAREDARLYASALRTLHSYYFFEHLYWQSSREYRKNKNDPAYLRKVSRQSKQSAKRAVELYDRIISEVDPGQDINARFWLQSWLVEGLEASWFDERGRRKLFLSDRQRYQRLTQYLNRLSLQPKSLYEAHAKLAALSDDLHEWSQAIESYQHLLEHPEQPLPDFLPVREDLQHIEGNVVDQQIDAAFRIAAIHRDHLQQPEIAIRKFQQLVSDFGVTHHRGVDVIQALHALGASFEFPHKSALIWGGGADALRAWSSVLKPQGYTCHRVGQYQISRAHLEPYDLVILVRTGMLPFEPTDILALRSFVATGGSLLVVVSPGWEPAAVGIHNSLLSCFDIHAAEESVIRATSTKLTLHPITNGIKQVMAKNAVPLSVPRESAWIQSGNKTLLAALPYRKGRLIVCSFGQWFQPDPGRPAWLLKRHNQHWTRNIPPAQRPVESGRNVHMPLLRHVVRWLDEPHRDATRPRNQKLLASALRTSLLVQFQVLSRDQLVPEMDRLVADVSDGVWREEALWIAGEACLQLCYFTEGNYGLASYGWKRGEPIGAQPRYYQELIDRFPDSSLTPMAQWRLADCGWRVYLNHGNDAPVRMQTIIQQYQRVDAPEGSVLWSWSRLRIASLRFQHGDYKRAAENYREVTERVGLGPEKSIALLNLGVCRNEIGQPAEADATFRQVKSVPDIFWWTTSRYANWAPMDADGYSIIGTSHKIAEKQVKEK